MSFVLPDYIKKLPAAVRIEHVSKMASDAVYPYLKSHDVEERVAAVNWVFDNSTPYAAMILMSTLPEKSIPASKNMINKLSSFINNATKKTSEETFDKALYTINVLGYFSVIVKRLDIANSPDVDAINKHLETFVVNYADRRQGEKFEFAGHLTEAMLTISDGRPISDRLIEAIGRSKSCTDILLLGEARPDEFPDAINQANIWLKMRNGTERSLLLALSKEPDTSDLSVFIKRGVMKLHDLVRLKDSARKMLAEFIGDINQKFNIQAVIRDMVENHTSPTDGSSTVSFLNFIEPGYGSSKEPIRIASLIGPMTALNIYSACSPDIQSQLLSELTRAFMAEYPNTSTLERAHNIIHSDVNKQIGHVFTDDFAVKNFFEDSKRMKISYSFHIATAVLSAIDKKSTHPIDFASAIKKPDMDEERLILATWSIFHEFKDKEKKLLIPGLPKTDQTKSVAELLGGETMKNVENMIKLLGFDDETKFSTILDIVKKSFKADEIVVSSDAVKPEDISCPSYL